MYTDIWTQLLPLSLCIQGRALREEGDAYVA